MVLQYSVFLLEGNNYAEEENVLKTDLYSLEETPVRLDLHKTDFSIHWALLYHRNR